MSVISLALLPGIVHERFRCSNRRLQIIHKRSSHVYRTEADWSRSIFILIPLITWADTYICVTGDHEMFHILRYVIWFVSVSCRDAYE